MLVAWLWLANACGARIVLSPRITVLLLLLALAGVFVTPVAYLAHDVTSVEHRNLLTWAMRLGGGPAIVPVALAAVLGVLTVRLSNDAALLFAARGPLSSVLLFAAGGVIGVFIHGSNVRIPAQSPRQHRRRDAGPDGRGSTASFRPRAGYQIHQGRGDLAALVVYGMGQPATSSVWSGLAAMACSARWPAPIRCCAARPKLPAWA